ncbi:hypothetical protein VUR80DRAFT_5115 [Thermomyces stellatus]
MLGPLAKSSSHSCLLRAVVAPKCAAWVLESAGGRGSAAVKLEAATSRISKTLARASLIFGSFRNQIGEAPAELERHLLLPHRRTKTTKARSQKRTKPHVPITPENPKDGSVKRPPRHRPPLAPPRLALGPRRRRLPPGHALRRPSHPRRRPRPPAALRLGRLRGALHAQRPRAERHDRLPAPAGGRVAGEARLRARGRRRRGEPAGAEVLDVQAEVQVQHARAGPCGDGGLPPVGRRGDGERGGRVEVGPGGGGRALRGPEGAGLGVQGSRGRWRDPAGRAGRGGRG